MLLLFPFTAGTCTIPTRNSFTRPPRLQPVAGATFIPEYGATLNYTQQFLILPCDKGPRPEGTDASFPEVDYPVTPATTTAVFGADGGLTVTCVFDVANGQYVLDRRDAMDCETYGAQENIPVGCVPTAAVASEDPSCPTPPGYLTSHIPKSP